jgi:hypothetical protein
MSSIEIPPDLTAAIGVTAKALAERRQLLDIRDRSVDAARIATNAKSAAVRRLGELEADAELEAEREHGRAALEAELHGKSDAKAGQRNAGSKLQKEIDSKRREIAEHEAAIAKADRLAKALPLKLIETDAAVEAANTSLQNLIVPFLVSAESRYRSEISSAAASLIETLARWHAIGSALRIGNILQNVRDVSIPALRPGEPAALFDGFTFKDGQRVNIADVAAPGVSDELGALQKVLSELPSAMLAIRNDEERRRQEENAARAAAAPPVKYSTPALRAAPPPAPPARFTPTRPSSYSSPSVAREANVALAGRPAMPGEVHPMAGVEQR